MARNWHRWVSFLIIFHLKPILMGVGLKLGKIQNLAFFFRCNSCVIFARKGKNGSKPLAMHFFFNFLSFETHIDGCWTEIGKKSNFGLFLPFWPLFWRNSGVIFARKDKTCSKPLPLHFFFNFLSFETHMSRCRIEK